MAFVFHSKVNILNSSTERFLLLKFYAAFVLKDQLIVSSRYRGRRVLEWDDKWTWRG